MAKRKVKKQVRSSNSSSNWAGLPDDLLDSILEKFVCLSDIIRFSAVCKPWNSKSLIYKEKRMLQINHQLPWLFISTLPDGKKRKQSLLDFTDGSEILNLKLSIPDNFKHEKCFGSSFGWLFYKEIKNSIIVVLNPFSGTIIRLPPISIPDDGDFKVSFKNIEDFVLSNDPCFGSFEVLAIYSDSDYDIVAHLQFGNEFWTYSKKIRSVGFQSFAFYKNWILGVNKSGIVFSLRIVKPSRSIKFKEIAPNLYMIRYSSPILSTFVKTTNGDLLLVHSYHGFAPARRCYSIFKIIYLNRKFDRIPVANLDGHSLFLKNNPNHQIECISVLASNFSECRANSIYSPYIFRGIGHISERNIAEFKLEDRSVRMEIRRFPKSQIWSSVDTVFWLVPPVG